MSESFVITRRNGTRHTVLYDKIDEQLVKRHRWWIRPANSNSILYAYTMKTGIIRATISMHELILPTREDVDHRDGNGLNNTRINLRVATRSQNLANQLPQQGRSSVYKGVCWDKDRSKWLAYIKVNQVRKNLGRFTSEIEAAKAYDRVAIAAWGEFSRTNFPKDSYL